MLANLKHKPTQARLYERVSTKRQGKSGLGLAAQHKTATDKAAKMGLEIIEVCEEVESGRRTTLRRPVLRQALDDCAKDGAVLIIAKMDRLTRNFSFLQWILEYTEHYGVAVVACDVPELADADNTKFLWRILASVAELEVANTRKRTKAALAEAKKNGVKLGNNNVAALSADGGRAMQAHRKEHALRVIPVIEEIEAAGIKSYRGIARALTARGIKTYGDEKKQQNSMMTKDWHAQAVKNIFKHRKQDDGNTKQRLKMPKIAVKSK